MERERERVVLCEFYGPHKRTNELVGMKRNYQHLLSSKKWMLAFSIDRKCINRDVRRGWKKIYSIFFLIILFILSSLLLMMKKEDFVVRKIKRKEEILECVDGWTKLTFFKRERERTLWMCIWKKFMWRWELQQMHSNDDERNSHDFFMILWYQNFNQK